MYIWVTLGKAFLFTLRVFFAECGLFPGPKKNLVFNAATIWWPQGLASPPGHILPWSHYSRPHGPDRRVQQITQNLFGATLQ
jgi:hypothetical protein